MSIRDASVERRFLFQLIRMASLAYLVQSVNMSGVVLI